MKNHRNHIVTLTLAVSFLVVTNVRADMLFELRTDASWIVKHYGTFGTPGYNPENDGWAIDRMNTAMIEGVFTTGPTRVYNTSWDYNTLGNWDGSFGWNMDNVSNLDNPGHWIGMRNGLSANDILMNPDTWINDTLGAWNLSGYYSFQTTFSLADAHTGINFNFWNDNAVIGISLVNSVGGSWNLMDYIIGGTTAIDDYWNHSTVFNDSIFDAGDYTLTFYLINGLNETSLQYAEWANRFFEWEQLGRVCGWSGPLGPVGLRVEGTMGGDAVVPEPATLAVLGLGLAGLGLMRARRKK